MNEQTGKLMDQLAGMTEALSVSSPWGKPLTGHEDFYSRPITPPVSDPAPSLRDAYIIAIQILAASRFT